MNSGLWSSLLRKMVTTPTFYFSTEKESMYKKKIGTCKYHRPPPWCKLFPALAVIFIWKRLTDAYKREMSLKFGNTNSISYFEFFYYPLSYSAVYLIKTFWSYYLFPNSDLDKVDCLELWLIFKLKSYLN